MPGYLNHHGLKRNVCLASIFLALFASGLLRADVTTNLPTVVTGGSGAVSAIQTNDGVLYVAAKGNTVNISGFRWFSGSVTSVVLHAKFTVDAGYTGNKALTVNGTTTAIVPTNGNVNRTVTLDLTGGSFLVDSWPKIKSTTIQFANNDTGGGDSVRFDYVYLVINHGSPDGFISPTWSDEFEFTGPPDPSVWTFETGYQRNNELQYYTTNAWREGGQLIIEGRRENIFSGYDYTSASINSSGKFYWQYGRAQIRAKIPCLAGLWPAIWGVGQTGEWPSGGECDIMEFYGGKILANCARGTTTQWTAAWDSSTRTIASLLTADPGWTNSYHIWTIQWDQDNVRLYVDSYLMNTIPQSWLVNPVTTWGPQYPFKQPFTIWLNLAIGGNAGGDPSATPFPQRYYVDYWRIWEGATNNVAPADISISTNSVAEGLPAGTVVGYLSATDANPAEVIKYILVSGTGSTNNSQFSIPEFLSDSTDKNVLKSAALLKFSDGATRTIRVRATDIEGLTYEKILTINIVSTSVTNANLTSLVLNPSGALAPAFSVSGTNYAATNAYGVSPTLTVINSDLLATNRLIFKGTTNLLESGVASSPLPLTLGVTNPVVVRVTARDGVTVKTYKVNVTMLPSQTVPSITNSLSGGQLRLAWPADHLGYTLQMKTNGLNQGAWINVPGSSSITSTNLPINPAMPTTFYRLVYP